MTTFVRITAVCILATLAALPARAVGIDLAARNLVAAPSPAFVVPMFDVLLMPLDMGFPASGSGASDDPDMTFVSGTGAAPFGDTDFTLNIGAASDIIDATSVEVALDGDTLEVLFEVTAAEGAFSGFAPFILGRGDLPQGFDPAMPISPGFTTEAEFTAVNIIPVPAAAPLMLGALGLLALVRRRA